MRNDSSLLVTESVVAYSMFLQEESGKSLATNVNSSGCCVELRRTRIHYSGLAAASQLKLWL